ncbi:MAG: hypothetical protein JU82_03235 [Sulfuricurvum sp. MLSB]|nr:hypothetical protein [Sulfuricurvum sp. UBA5598]KFN40410.1 MAG: hypothetical protein JU82_03235 [Sulfuricurvum sp. MLSB]
MSPNTLRLGAILIADAHCAPWRTPFIDFLRSLEKGEIQTSQLVLMGDVFDLLFGPIEATHALNAEGIELLNRLSKRMEVIYLEGNHDFLLSGLFPQVTVVPRCKQPWIASFEGKTIALSHGDSAMGFGYEAYTALIRNPYVLKVLHMIDNALGGWIVRKLVRAMQRKHHCKTIEHFDVLISKRLKHQKTADTEMLIEGHFHQNRTFDLPELQYVNLAAFACNERYFSVQSSQNQPLLHEAVFRKEPL